MESAARDVFVISDLHLGDGGVRDNFEAGGRTPQLHAFLDHVGSEGGELFILGDLFELWQMSLSRLFVKRRAMLDRLATLPLVYVPGNHDVDLAHFIGTEFLAHPFFTSMRAPFVRELGGKRFRFFHGHEIDPFNSGDDPGFGRMFSIFAGVFEDENGSPIHASGESMEDILEQFGDSVLALWTCAMATIGARATGNEVSPRAALTPAQNPDRLVEHVTEVRADLERCGYDVAVLGHTHRPGRLGDWYFNSGSWTGPLNSFLRISPDGHVRFFEWKEGRAIEHQIPVVLPTAQPDRAPSAAKNPFEAAISSVRTLFPKPKKPARSRWVLLVQGALALSLGAGTLFISVGEGSSAGLRLLATAFGAFALLDGALSLWGASRKPPVKRLLHRVRGVASLLLGVVVLRHRAAVELFVVLVGVWALIAGALGVAASAAFKTLLESKWIFLMGAGSMLAGLGLLLWPPTAALPLKLALSGYLCFYGAGELLAGIFGQRRPRAARSIPV